MSAPSPARPSSSPWLDTPSRYGAASRFLHWAIAALIVWQFATLLGWRLLGDGPVMRFTMLIGPYHGTVGVLVLALVLPRALWSLASRRRRPPRERGALGLAARAVHAALYALLFAVPALALLRTYGSGKGYDLWGFALLPETGRKVAWMEAPANLLHGPLAWTLAALVAAHVAAALGRTLVLRDGTLRRMAGPLKG